MAGSYSIDNRGGEGTEGVQLVFDITRTEEGTVGYSKYSFGSLGGAAYGSDYRVLSVNGQNLTEVESASSGLLQFDSNNKAQIVVQLIDDTAPEPTETFTLTVSDVTADPGSGSATGTIFDNDQPTGGATGGGSGTGGGNGGGNPLRTPGADNLSGDDGANTVSLLLGSDTYHGASGDDSVYGNQGNDKLYGDDGKDYLFGGKDRDLLVGGDGRDVLDGGLGSDTLVGGGGADRFVLNRDPGSRDVIKDFNKAEGDRIDLRGQTYTTRFGGNGDTFLDLSGGGVVQLVGVTEAEFAQGGFFVGS